VRRPFVVLSGDVVYPAGIFLALVTVLLQRDWPRTLLGLVAVAHLTILASVALFPLPVDAALVAEGRAVQANVTGVESFNLVPFRTIAPVLAGLGAPGSTRLLVLNTFVLFPAGIYLPLLWPALRRRAALVPLVLIGGATVELAQLAISTVLGFRYRSIDVDDAILNGIGLGLGWLLVAATVASRQRLRRWRRSRLR
jgi:glycopeptide antibiotics resistance protein